MCLTSVGGTTFAMVVFEALPLVTSQLVVTPNSKAIRELLQHLLMYQLEVGGRMQPLPTLLTYTRSGVVAIKALRWRIVGLIFATSMSDKCLTNLRGWTPTSKIKLRSWRLNIKDNVFLLKEQTNNFGSTWQWFDRMRSNKGGSA
jgi:hypothetical protein